MKNPITQWIIAFLIALISFFIRLTCRWKVHNQPKELKAQPSIIALWHGRLLMMPFLFPFRIKVHALISAHRDGRIIMKAASFFGIKTITGSSSSGGANALREMTRKIKQGDSIFITPDGPKGPRCEAHSGALELARITKAPILPVAINPRKAWIIDSWDQFNIPKPFSTIDVMWGKAILVENKEEREAKQKELQNKLNELQQG